MQGSWTLGSSMGGTASIRTGRTGIPGSVRTVTLSPNRANRNTWMCSDGDDTTQMISQDMTAKLQELVIRCCKRNLA